MKYMNEGVGGSSEGGHVALPWVAYLIPFTFAFDFRGDEGGGLSQYIMAGAACFLIGIGLLTSGFRIPSHYRWYFLFSVFAVVMGLVTALVYDVPGGQIIRVSFPFIQFVLCGWIGAQISNQPRRLLVLLNMCCFAGIISSVFRYFWGLSYAGLYLDNVRYQILSPGLPFLVAFSIAGVLFCKKFPIVSLLVAAWIFLLSLLSVTRSLIITAGFGIIAMLFIVYKLGFNNPAHKQEARWRVVTLIVSIIVLTCGGIGALLLRPDVMDSWRHRLFEQKSTVDSVDITYTTRMAEAVGIWDEVSVSAESIVFGRGFGNFYSWSGEYAAQLDAVTRNYTYMNTNLWWASHSVFTYGLFFGGAVGLCWVVYLYFYPIYMGWTALNFLKTSSDGVVLRCYMICVLAIFLYLSQSFTSQPFGERLSAQYLGFCCGALITLCGQMREVRQFMELRTDFKNA